MKKRFFLKGMAIVLAAVMLAGCASGSGKDDDDRTETYEEDSKSSSKSLSAEDYKDKFEKAMEDYQDAFSDLSSMINDDDFDKNDAKKSANAAKAALDDIIDLNPPKDIKNLHKEMCEGLELAKDMVDLYYDYGVASSKGDEDETEKIEEKAEKLEDELEAYDDVYSELEEKIEELIEEEENDDKDDDDKDDDDRKSNSKSVSVEDYKAELENALDDFQDAMNDLSYMFFDEDLDKSEAKKIANAAKDALQEMIDVEPPKDIKDLHKEMCEGFELAIEMVDLYYDYCVASADEDEDEMEKIEAKAEKLEDEMSKYDDVFDELDEKLEDLIG